MNIGSERIDVKEKDDKIFLDKLKGWESCMGRTLTDNFKKWFSHSICVNADLFAALRATLHATVGTCVAQLR